MIKLIEIKTHHKLYSFIEELMNAAFPMQERRDSDLQRNITNLYAQFHNCIIMDKDTPIGLLTYWDFTSFCYIEHFAIAKEVQNKGYGQMALSHLKKRIKVPIVLEVEEPIDETSKKRIRFYKRQGFLLQEVPYLQPPYRKGEEWFPLKLMTYGAIDINQDYSLIKNIIYQEVYQVTP